MNESQFTSLHQPKGLCAAWPPDGRASYRTMTSGTPPRNFKVFIPPGARMVNLLAHVDQGDNLIYRYSARLGQPPTTSWMDSGRTKAGFTIQNLAMDCHGVNSGGYVFFVQDVLSTPAKDGKWLYVQIIRADGGIRDIQTTIQVDAVKYKSWYATQKWGSNGDPIAGAVVVPSVVDIVISQAQWGAIQAGARVNWIVRG